MGGGGRSGGRAGEGGGGGGGGRRERRPTRFHTPDLLLNRCDFGTTDSTPCETGMSMSGIQHVPAIGLATAHSGQYQFPSGAAFRGGLRQPMWYLGVMRGLGWGGGLAGTRVRWLGLN